MECVPVLLKHKKGYLKWKSQSKLATAAASHQMWSAGVLKEPCRTGSGSSTPDGLLDSSLLLLALFSFFFSAPVWDSHVSTVVYIWRWKLKLACVRPQVIVDASLPQIAAEIGHNVGVFAVLHHDDLLLDHSKVLTCRANTPPDQWEGCWSHGGARVTQPAERGEQVWKLSLFRSVQWPQTLVRWTYS